MRSISLIFVHGMWHSPECFSKIIPKLEGAGLRCIAPQMLFASQEPPVESNEPDIQLLQQLIQTELSDGRDVVIICHSLGGLHGASALRGLVGKDATSHQGGQVKGLILIAAVMVPTGTAVNDARGGDYAPYMTEDHNTGWVHLNCDPVSLFYNDLPSEEGKYWASRLVKQSMYCSVSSQGIYAGYLDVPVWYLMCAVDQTVPFDIQQGIVESARRAGAKVTTRTLPCGHCPFLSQPDETIAIIHEALTSFT